LTGRMPGATGGNSQGRLIAREKREKAARARLRGEPWAKVAKIAGYASPGAACAAVGEYLRQHPSQEVEQLREMENMKLDRLERAANRVLQNRHVVVQQGKVVGRFTGWRRNPVDGSLWVDDSGRPQPVLEEIEDDAPVLAAIASLLKIAERRAKNNGTDMPVRISVEDNSVDDEIEALITELSKQQGNMPSGSPG
jgi:hypothetical protein